MNTQLQLISLFFFNDPPTTEIYTLSLHDALPISDIDFCGCLGRHNIWPRAALDHAYCNGRTAAKRSEEHTSELQSPMYLVCRLLLEKKKQSQKIQVYLNIARLQHQYQHLKTQINI